MSIVASYRLRGFDQGNLAEIELFNLMGYHPDSLKARGYWKPKYRYGNELYLNYSDYTIFETSHKVSRKCEDVLSQITKTEL